jgi:hypothetical protein
MGCLCCGAAPAIGALCRRCALEISPCDGLIADHIRSTIDATEAEAWVVDGFGAAHAIRATCGIGRNHDRDLVVLASSVSREHAQLTRTETGWMVRDLGSRNGTFVDGVRCQGRSALPASSLLKIGDVALRFLTEVSEKPTEAPAMETGVAGGRLVHYQLTYGEAELCVLGGSEPAAGGTLLSRARGAIAWSERGLPPLEFQLLRLLCVRAHDEAALPSAVRGCVSTKQLARDLPFQSKYANEENVRQVVRRLRGVLAGVGADGVLAAAPGRGYYIACSVTVPGGSTHAGADRL